MDAFSCALCVDIHRVAGSYSAVCVVGEYVGIGFVARLTYDVGMICGIPCGLLWKLCRRWIVQGRKFCGRQINTWGVTFKPRLALTCCYGAALA